MTDAKLGEFIRKAGHPVLIRTYGTDDDEHIRHFIWLLEVPEADIVRAQDEATDLAFQLYGDDPVPFVIGVASPTKTLQLRAHVPAQLQLKTIAKTTSASVFEAVATGQAHARRNVPRIAQRATNSSSQPSSRQQSLHAY